MSNKKMMLIAMAAVLIVGTSVYADKGEPGGQNDPIVSKSYVDAKIQELEEEIIQLENQMYMLNEQVAIQNNIEMPTYELVTVPKGSMILGETGTEMIVRTGEGQVVAGLGGGIQNLTEGVDLVGGNTATKYHLLLVPREDGRGILATSELIVMVRGGYTIQ